MTLHLVLVGHRPDRLGGYREHSPARLYLTSRIRAALRSRGASLVTCNLELGVGQWAAEAALAEGVPFDAVLTSDQAHGRVRWNASQLARLRELTSACRESAIVDATAQERDRFMLASAADEGAEVVVVQRPDVFSGRTAEARRYAEGRGVVEVWDPTRAPRAWQAVAALEDLRGALDDRLDRLVAEALAQLDASAGGVSLVWRARDRLRQVETLRDVVAAIKSRS